MKLTRNSFEGRRNTDANSSVIQPNQYRNAYNIELVGGGEYFAAQNLNGTTEVRQIVSDSSVFELGTFPNKYIIDGVEYPCLTIFTYSYASEVFKIWCYNPQIDELYELYEEEVGSSYLKDDMLVDAANYPENGTDILYFTDNQKPLRFIKCQIDSYTPNFLSEYDITLLRLGANGRIAVNSISTGGSVLTGTYQFVYRMINPLSSPPKFTKWSTPTNPIHVYTASSLSSDPVYAGIGLVSTNKITLTVTPSTPETDNFDYVQIAVIENTNEQQPTTASLLEIQPIVTSLSFDYTNNSNIGTIPIEDITVDLAEIATAKTIKVKENRLFIGNITYADLEADNGTPEVTSGSVISYVNTSPSNERLYSNEVLSSNRKGYFRGEVYRFGLLCRDKNGYGRIFPLDLTSKITGNQITGAPDLKFPSRETSSSYSLFDTSDRIKALGVNFTGITNIPSWTKSVEVVRVEREGRYKDILFQTPIIPMMEVYGTGAFGEYPTSYYNGATNLVPDASPMTASSTFIPKNLWWPELRDIKQFGSVINTTLSGGIVTTSTTIALPTEVRHKRRTSFSEACLFPQDSMYSTTPFSFTGSESLDVVDYVALKVRASSDTSDNTPTGTPVASDGESIYTKTTGTFYAVEESYYYFDSTWSGKTIPSTLKNIPIKDYEFFESLSTSSKSLNGKTVMGYDELRTKNTSVWQDIPAIQKMGCVKLQNSLSESSRVFKIGTLNAAGNNNYILGSSGAKYESSLVLTNKYISDYSSYSNSSVVSSIPIANVKMGLYDTRYGDISYQHNYISTGAKYTMSQAEIDTLEGGGNISIDLDVWGGDCFISSHIFKISDTTFSVTNPTKVKTDNTVGTSENDTTIIQKWKLLYNIGTGNPNYDNSSIPVAVDASAQFVQVILESEYNGDAVDKDITIKDIAVNRVPIMKVDDSSYKVPLAYKYNINLNINNEQKIYLPKQQYSFEQNEFKARIAYSDIKIYNSDQVGFDIIRVGNIKDLEESKYGITKLAIAGDNLYAIQEIGVSYVPTGERQIESTDAGTLSVRSGDVVGRVLTINSEKGSQHSRSVVETGDTIFLVDNIKRDVYLLSGTEMQPITEGNETIFRSLLINPIPERDIIGFYDPVRKDIYFNINSNCQVFNNGWVGEYEFNPRNGISQNGNMYLIGKVSNILRIYTAHTGDVNDLFGTIVVPRIEFYINPDESISKTFDQMSLDASDRLLEADFVVERESSLGNQSVSGVDLDVLSREGSFRVQTLRDSNNSRLRGMRVKATIKWQNLMSSLKYVWTKYRPSSRTPF